MTRLPDPTNRRRWGAGLCFVAGAAAQVALALEPPVEIDWESPSNTSVTFRWTNAEPDAQVEFEYQRSNGSWSNLGICTKPGTEVLPISNLQPGIPIPFRLRTVKADSECRILEASGYSESITAVTRELALDGAKCVAQPPGAFEYPLETQGFSAAQISLSGLPDTVAVVDSPLRIAGTLAAGLYPTTVSAVDGRHRRVLKLSVVVNTAPAIAVPVPNHEVAIAAEPGVHDLNTVFTDPDTETTVRIETVLGNIDVSLSDTATPLTVANFLRYADRGAWDGTFFHRSVTGFVIQAGGFSPRDDEKIAQIAPDAPVANEFSPSRPNVCGTMAMAKLGGNPDSATNQWFFNTNDNSGNLDNQNGGFTTFARVLGSGMDVVNAIAALPSRDYLVTVVTCSGEPPNQSCAEQQSLFRGWPLLQIREDGLDSDDFVTISRVARVAPMTFAIASQSAPEVASASIADSGKMTLNYLSPGTTTITVTATDLDGLTTAHTFSVSVGESFTHWATGAGLQGNEAEAAANPDGDIFGNLLEYAFGGNPLLQDPGSLAPVAAPSAQDAGNPMPAISFLYRPGTIDLAYTVQLSARLQDGWAAIWSSGLGLEHPNVLGIEEAHDDLLRVTIGARDTPLPAFMRVLVETR